jgi:predicted Zn-dependent peptidase
MNRADLDGVPVFWEDSPGPFSASLVFGVGARHETFRTVGVTHLVEHLVMATLPKSHLDSDAEVGIESTSFNATGRPQAVVDFIAGVCAAIADLPLGRLAVEIGVLEAEDGMADHPAMCTALNDRYGFTGIGLLGANGAGVKAITAEQVSDHLRRFFVRGNAVLVLTGPPPPGLAVSLPPGLPPEAVKVAASRQRVPGTQTYEGSMPSLSIEVARNESSEGAGAVEGDGEAAAGALMRILVERMTDSLRHRQGIAYDVDCSSAVVDSTRMLVTFWADGREGKMGKVATGIWEALQSLAQEGPSLEEIAYDRAGLDGYLEESRATLNRLEYAGMRHLRGLPARTPDESRAAHDRLTCAHLRELAAGSLATALLQLPEEVEVRLAGLPALDGDEDRYGDAPVSGRTYRRRSLSFAPLSLRAVVGDLGVSFQASGETLTVLWADVVGLGMGPTERHLIATDGAVLRLSSKEFRGGDDLFDSIDSTVARALWFKLPREWADPASSESVAPRRH